MHETEAAFVLTADLPGFTKEDLAVEVSADGLVRLSGKRALPEPEGARWLLRERQALEFSRSLRLPAQVQQGAAAARFEAGVLTLTLPKAAPRGSETVKVAVQ